MAMLVGNRLNCQFHNANQGKAANESQEFLFSPWIIHYENKRIWPRLPPRIKDNIGTEKYKKIQEEKECKNRKI